MSLTINSLILPTNQCQFDNPNQKQNSKQNLFSPKQDSFINANKPQVSFTGGKTKILSKISNKILESFKPKKIAGILKKEKPAILEKPFITCMSASEDAKKASKAAEEAKGTLRKIEEARKKLEATINAQKSENEWKAQVTRDREFHKAKMEMLEGQSKAHQEYLDALAKIDPKERAKAVKEVAQFMDRLNAEIELARRGIHIDEHGNYFDLKAELEGAPRRAIPKEELLDYLKTRDSNEINEKLNKVDKFLQKAEESLGFKGNESFMNPIGPKTEQVEEAIINPLTPESEQVEEVIINPLTPESGQVGEGFMNPSKIDPLTPVNGFDEGVNNVLTNPIDTQVEEVIINPLTPESGQVGEGFMNPLAPESGQIEEGFMNTFAPESGQIGETAIDFTNPSEIDPSHTGNSFDDGYLFDIFKKE